MKIFTLLVLLTLFSLIGFAQTFTVSPSSGTQGQTLVVTITGANTHFASGSSSNYVEFSFNQGTSTVTLSPTSISYVSATKLLVHLTIPAYYPIGYYDATVIDPTDPTMTKTSAFRVALGVGIDAVNENKSIFNIYPNPSKDYINIEQTNAEGEECKKIEIVDITGKIVLQKESISGKCKVDIANLSRNQTYFVRLLDKNNKAIEVKKFFVSQ